jgi:hypothetical protein
MARSYSDEFINATKNSNSTSAGITLAKLCLKANLPAKYIADFMRVSRMTVYAWFRGGYLREKNLDLITDLISILEIDLAKGILPVTSIENAKGYLNSIVDTQIVD